MTQPVEVVSAEDTITAEVVRNALAVAVEEASIVVVRSAHSTLIQEGADAARGDARRRVAALVALSAATSLMHGASLRCSLKALARGDPAREMRPGDVFALNDPYRGGIHANDVLVFRPVFVDGRPMWFSGTLIHIADLGGVARRVDWPRSPPTPSPRASSCRRCACPAKASRSGTCSASSSGTAARPRRSSAT